MPAGADYVILSMTPNERQFQSARWYSGADFPRQTRRPAGSLERADLRRMCSRFLFSPPQGGSARFK